MTSDKKKKTFQKNEDFNKNKRNLEWNKNSSKKLYRNLPPSQPM